jgi:hypothetical protein
MSYSTTVVGIGIPKWDSGIEVVGWICFSRAEDLILEVVNVFVLFLCLLGLRVLNGWIASNLDTIPISAKCLLSFGSFSCR